MKGHVTLATQEHVEQLLADGLRSADQAELLAVGVTPREALERGLADSRPHCLAAIVDGRAAALFGVADSPDIPCQGIIWLLGSSRILQIRRQFLRESLHWVDEFSKSYLLLANAVHKDNHLHLRWVQWLGFTLLPEVGDFVPFVRIPKCAM